MIVIARLAVHENFKGEDARVIDHMLGFSIIFLYHILAVSIAFLFVGIFRQSETPSSLLAQFATPLHPFARLGALITGNVETEKVAFMQPGGQIRNKQLIVPMAECLHDGQWIYLLEIVNMFVLGCSLGLDLWLPMMRTKAPSAILSLAFMGGFLLTTRRETGPRRIKCGFHAQLSPLGLALFIVAGWLAYIIGLHVGAVRHRRGLKLSAGGAEDQDWELGLTCSITCERFQDPVTAPDGHTYERSAIEEWLKSNTTSPLTGEAMPAGELRTSYAMRSLLEIKGNRRSRTAL